MKQPTTKQREKSYKALLEIAKEENDTEAIAYYERMLRLVNITKAIEEDFI